MIKDLFTKGKAQPILKEVGSVAFKYLKTQLILLLINLVVLTVGMVVLDMKWWSFPIALAIAVIDILPVFGSGAVFIPWIIYSIVKDAPAMALGLGLLYGIMIALRLIFEPIICGKKIGLSPLGTLAAAIGGICMFGPYGLLVGPLVVAVIKIVYNSNTPDVNR